MRKCINEVKPEENPYVDRYETYGGNVGMEGWPTLKDARWWARQYGCAVREIATGKTVLDYRD